jgi:hypothetical protein
VPITLSPIFIPVAAINNKKKHPSRVRDHLKGVFTCPAR